MKEKHKNLLLRLLFENRKVMDLFEDIAGVGTDPRRAELIELAEVIRIIKTEDAVPPELKLPKGTALAKKIDSSEKS